MTPTNLREFSPQEEYSGDMLKSKGDNILAWTEIRQPGFRVASQNKVEREWVASSEVTPREKRSFLSTPVCCIGRLK